MSFYDDPCVSDEEASAFRAQDIRVAICWLRKYYPKLLNGSNEQLLGQALVDYRNAVARNRFD